MDHSFLHICMFLLKTKKWFVDTAKIKTIKWVWQCAICCLIPRADSTHFCLKYLSWVLSIIQNRFAGEHHQPFTKNRCFPIFLSFHQRWVDVHPPRRSLMQTVYLNVCCKLHCLVSAHCCSPHHSHKTISFFFPLQHPPKMGFPQPHSPKTVCVLFPFTLRSTKCGFHFSEPNYPKTVWEFRSLYVCFPSSNIWPKWMVC